MRELSCRNSFTLFAFCLDAGYRLQNLPFSKAFYSLFTFLRLRIETYQSVHKLFSKRLFLSETWELIASGFSALGQPLRLWYPDLVRHAGLHSIPTHDGVRHSCG